MLFESEFALLTISDSDVFELHHFLVARLTKTVYYSKISFQAISLSIEMQKTGYRNKELKFIKIMNFPEANDGTGIMDSSKLLSKELS